MWMGGGGLRGRTLRIRLCLLCRFAIMVRERVCRNVGTFVIVLVVRWFRVERSGWMWVGTIRWWILLCQLKGLGRFGFVY